MRSSSAGSDGKEKKSVSSPPHDPLRPSSPVNNHSFILARATWDEAVLKLPAEKSTKHSYVLAGTRGSRTLMTSIPRDVSNGNKRCYQ